MAYYMNKNVPAKRGDIFYISNSKCYATDPSNTEGRPAIVAEYVRSRYPEIEKTFDFTAYYAGVALKEFGRCIKEAFEGTDKEVDDVCDSEH